jgi:division protein CdvB (Snf7/Vps24/ESCRT-III family)
LSNIQMMHPPAAMLDTVEIALSALHVVKAVVLDGNSQLQADMERLFPVTTGELPQLLIPHARLCLDEIMVVAEQRVLDGLNAIQAGMQEHLEESYTSVTTDCASSIAQVTESLDILGKVDSATKPSSAETGSMADRAEAAAHQRMCKQMDILTEKTYTIRP